MTDESQTPAAKPLRLRTRFSLRTLLITIAVVAVLLVIANNYVRPKLEHRVAVGRIFNSGGAVWFQDKSEESGVQNPYTAQTLNLWRNVDGIDVKNDAQAAIVSQELVRIPEAGVIEFGRGVTDVGLSAVTAASNREAIEVISFFLCSITSDGISKLQQIPKLRQIMFNTCPVTAAGLAELKKLPRLRTLRFVEEPPGRNFSRLNNRCFTEIGELVQLESLHFGTLNISDTAARKLHNLKQLKTLSFIQGYISDAAISELRFALPTTDIYLY